MLLKRKNKIIYATILIIFLLLAFLSVYIANKVNDQSSVDLRSNALDPSLPTITINTETDLGTFKEGLSANNIEAGLPLWPKSKNIQFQNLAASQSLIQNAKYSRFPMGCIVDIYPFPRDPSNWQLLDQPQYGGTYGRFNLKDWLDYIANSQSEPIITVNTQGRHPYESCVNGPYFEGTSEDAAHMVEFFNKPNDGNHPWAALRANLGYANPLGVKYWQIGNEPYSDNREGRTNFATIEARIENYAQTVIEFATSMKQIDPTIKIAAVTHAHSGSSIINGIWSVPPHQPEFYRDQLYSVAGFEQAIDMVSVHNEQRGGCDDETAYVHALTRQAERSDTLRELYTGKLIYFDETSLCTDPKKANLSLLFGNVTALMEMARKGVDISAYWYLVTYMQENSTFQETAGTVYTYDLTQNFKTPVYYFHKDYMGLLLNKKIIQTTLTNNETFNYVWDVAVRGECPVTDGCPVSTPNVPYQTAIAVKSNDGNKIYLLVVNIKNQDTAMQINMNEANYSNAVKSYTISGNTFLDQNTLVNPNNVNTRTNNEVLERVAGGYIKTFDKYSVTLVEFDIESPPTGTVANPTYSPVAGTYTSAQTVTINTATSGASIRYTLDNTEPDETSTLYTIPLSINTTTTVKAKAYKEGMNPSPVSSAIYTINISPSQVAAPTFNPVGGTYTSAQSVIISSATPGSAIRYTTNGTDPTSTTGTLYSGPVSISTTTTLKAIAYKDGMNASSVSSAQYTINTTPVITEYSVVGTISFRYDNIPVTVTIKNGNTVVKTLTVNSISADNRIEFRLNASEVGAGNYTVVIKPRYYTAREGNLTLGANQNVSFTVSGEYYAGKYTTTNPDKITILDISRFLAYFRAGDHSKDLNGDGRINILDIVHMLNGYRATNT